MPAPVQVQQFYSQSNGNHLADKARTMAKPPQWFPKLLICFCVVQLVIVTAIAVVLAVFLKDYVSPILYRQLHFMFVIHVYGH